MDSFLHFVLEVHVESVLKDELDFPVLDKEMSSGFIANLLQLVGEFVVLVAECACDGCKA